MDVVNVVVLSPIGRELLDRIGAVRANVSVDDASNLIIHAKGALVERMDPSLQGKLDALLARAEIIFGFAPPPNLITRAPRLKWISAPSAGIERFLIPDIIESAVLLTNSSGIHGVQVSETVFMMLLMLAKKASLFLQQQQVRLWQRLVPEVLQAKTMGILGLGVIGSEVAKRGKAFGLRVIALEAKNVGHRENVDAIFSPSQLREVLAQCDYVVVTLPLAPGTNKLLGEPELRAMKKTAYLVNVARGGIIDEAALTRALSENWIAGAGLDVFTTEPLPSESRLWTLPNVIITPHVAGDREDYNELAVNLFCDNLGRYLDGEELINLVNKKRGY
jgi:D-2-hydroxyacid dehydrogenase (NADP+)